MPNKAEALRKYARHAPTYDQRQHGAAELRRMAIARLALTRGDTVLDVGCGTGLSFPLIEEAIETDGLLIGIDQSRDMLARARELVERAGWLNVRLIESAAEDVALPQEADAALFHFTHDIMRTPVAVGNVVRHLKPQGRLVAIGLKWAPLWRVRSNVLVWRVARTYTTTFEGLRAPWSHLAHLIPNLHLESIGDDLVYLATGVKRA